MRVIEIIPGTSVDGPGLRTSIYFAGCRHHCAECHNPQSWDYNNGIEMSESQILEQIDNNGFNVTFTGGDPIFQAESIIPLAKSIKSRGYSIWLYTGYTFEELLCIDAAKRLLEYTDVVVDGPYIASLRSMDLRFRGSSNQRIINVQESLKTADNIPVLAILD